MNNTYTDVLSEVNIINMRFTSQGKRIREVCKVFVTSELFEFGMKEAHKHIYWPKTTSDEMPNVGG